MYVQGFIVPVPSGNQDEYQKMAKVVGDIMADYGATEIVEAWEDDIKDGEHNDFRTAVKAEEGEKIVFSWVIWPDKGTADSAHKEMMKDERLAGISAPPFDGKRMIFGSFKPIYIIGRN